MLRDYLRAALHEARYEILPDDDSVYAEIPSCRGVFANAPTVEACREQLEEVLEDWIFIRVHRGLELPAIGGLSLKVSEVA